MSQILPEEPVAAEPVLDGDLFQLFIESVSDYAMFLLDPGGHVMTWNEGARRIKGYEASEIVGRHFSVFYPPLEIRRQKPQFELTAAAADGRFEDEGWRIRKDGTRFWANVVITALFQNDELVGYAKVTRDLTERRKSEEERVQLLQLEREAREEAERSLEQVRVLQDVTEAALAFLPLDDLLRQLLDRVANALAADTAAILLLEENELVARAARGLEEEVEQGVHVPVGQGFAGRIAAQRRPLAITDVDHADILNPLLREKGIRSLLGVPLMIEGRVIGVLHIGTLAERHFTEGDTTLLQLVGDRAALAIERARLFAAEQMAQQQRDSAEALVVQRDSFLAVAAHELKNPVAVLSTAVQLLQRRLAAPVPSVESLRETVDTLTRQSAKLVQLLNNLLDVSRLETGKLRLVREPQDLTRLATEVVAVMRSQHPDVPLSLVADPDVKAIIDPLRVEQLLINLIDNAIKYSPGNDPVEVTLLAVENSIELSVCDHGLGIPPEHRAHVFNRFYQAHAESHRSGLGLGLAISREIAELHGGTLEAEFPADGGTRMILRLPSAGSSADSPPASPASVLVVDDETDIRELVMTALTDEGYQGRAVANGAEALRLVRDWHPTLILLDMRMPIMDGWEFARAYARTPGPHAPIVVMTAAAQAADWAREVGAEAALPKPFDLTDLFEVVESCIKLGA